MKILMVSPYPPIRDGVGRYAEQEVASLREEGHEVEVLSPFPSAAHYHVELKGGLKFARLKVFARNYDRVIIQYQPSHFHVRSRGPSRVLTSLGLLIAFSSIRNLVVVCHEVEYPLSGRHRWRLSFLLERAAWRAASEVILHSEAELQAMRERLGVEPKKITLRPPGAYYRSFCRDNKDEARATLGIPPDETVLLCIGFIQPHKGFDRAVRAFLTLDPPAARLVLAGSVRMESSEHRRYAEMLHALAAFSTKIDVREGMMSDEEFDRWIIASDCVLLPYREIWSSAVFERAKVLDRPVIAARVGAIPEQARDVDVLVEGDEELLAAMAARLHVEVKKDMPVNFEYEGVMALVTERAARARSIELGQIDGQPGSSDVDGMKARLAMKGSFHPPAVLRSNRLVLGPAFTVTKRVLRRGLDWYMIPITEQMRDFSGAVGEAFGSLQSEVSNLRVEFGANLTELQQAGSWERQNLSTEIQRVEERLGVIERRTRWLTEQVPAQPGTQPSAFDSTRQAGPNEGSIAKESQGHESDYTTLDYHLFEAKFRGDPAAIKERQRTLYLDHFRDKAPVLDIGCGRGEFLEALRDAGIDARGVDLNVDMVLECREKGLTVEHADGIAYLASLPEKSVGGIFAAQVVEHLTPRSLVAFLARGKAALKDGGILLVETINPTCLYALANAYSLDMTHEQPIHPETLVFLVQQEGFSSTEVQYHSPVLEKEPSELDPQAPAWAKEVLRDIEVRLDRLYDTVFGYQDYSLLATK